jgi:hypothetical protein
MFTGLRRRRRWCQLGRTISHTFVVILTCNDTTSNVTLRSNDMHFWMFKNKQISLINLIWKREKNFKKWKRKPKNVDIPYTFQKNQYITQPIALYGYVMWPLTSWEEKRKKTTSEIWDSVHSGMTLHSQTHLHRHFREMYCFRSIIAAFLFFHHNGGGRIHLQKLNQMTRCHITVIIIYQIHP